MTVPARRPPSSRRAREAAIAVVLLPVLLLPRSRTTGVLTLVVVVWAPLCAGLARYARRRLGEGLGLPPATPDHPELWGRLTAFRLPAVGTLGNVRASVYGGLVRGSWLAGVAAESGTTDGFIVVVGDETNRFV